MKKILRAQIRSLTLAALAVLVTAALAAPHAYAQKLLVTNQNTTSVLRYNSATGAFIDVFVTPGSGGLAGPEGLVDGPDGNLYVVSAHLHKILRYDGRDGRFIGEFVPDTGTQGNPTDLVFGPDGNLYVSSRFGGGIRRFNGRT